MTKNTAIKSLAELNNDLFLVEDYQRGYKWTPDEVLLLLDDINEFSGSGFYCLQPVVVKKVILDGTEKWELIDGQQRLTTLFIILSFLKASDDTLYHIEYRTRKSSERFLNEILNLNTEPEWGEYLMLAGNSDNDNIDNYHFYASKKKVSAFFKDFSADHRRSYFNKVQHQVKVIWYEVPGFANDEKSHKAESVKIFTRINSGKIPLTNAELIKALFLINAGDAKNHESLLLKQNEIAQQWDEIEYSLQNDAFWYFISNSEPGPTRIDLIFDLIADKQPGEEEKMFTFLAYNKDYYLESDHIAWVSRKWAKVKEVYQTLREWYEDKRLFHFIGFLIWRQHTLAEILEWKAENQASRQQFEDKVLSECRIKLGKGKKLSDVEYKEHHKVKSILLLHNILTLLVNENSNNFSFEKFKTGNWDIEHIHAQQSKDINDKKDWLIWIRETRKELEKLVPSSADEPARLFLLTLFDDIKEETLTKEQFDKLFDEVLKFYDLLDKKKQQTNALSNLALLDAKTNRSYQNAIFSVKRHKIIDRDKEGVFIPICTKNVFLKYYSDDLTQMFIWKSEDRLAYFADMQKLLKNYIIL